MFAVRTFISGWTMWLLLTRCSCVIFGLWHNLVLMSGAANTQWVVNTKFVLMTLSMQMWSSTFVMTTTTTWFVSPYIRTYTWNTIFICRLSVCCLKNLCYLFYTLILQNISIERTHFWMVINNQKTKEGIKGEKEEKCKQFSFATFVNFSFHTSFPLHSLWVFIVILVEQRFGLRNCLSLELFLKGSYRTYFHNASNLHIYFVNF